MSGYMKAIKWRVFIPADEAKSADCEDGAYISEQEATAKITAFRLTGEKGERVSSWEAEYLTSEEYEDGFKDVYDVTVELK